MSKGTGGAAPAAAGMDDSQLAQAASAHGAFDDTGKDFKWEGKAPSELEGNDKLGEMSMEDIEKEFGLDIPDRTRVAAPTGNMTVFEAEQAVADGTAVVPTEDALAAAAVAALQPPAAAPAADPAAAAQAAEAKPAAAADAAAAAPAAETGEGEQFVESRDGKGKIPYAVLEAERQKNARLQAELDTERGNKQRAAEDAAVKGALTDEQIAAMREEFPDAVVDAIAAQNDAIKELRKENIELKRKGASTEEDPAQIVQDIIDQDPVLSQWRTEHEQGNSANWNRAVRFDDMLREDPEWGQKTPQERFDQVRVLMGAPKAAPAPAKTEAQLAQERADEAARTATAAAAARPIAPTHSDLPGGAPPAQDEQGRIGSMSITDLEKLVEAHGPDAFLAKFG